VQPTIWTGLPETSRIVTEEISAPAATSPPFDSEEEVVVRPTPTTTASPPRSGRRTSRAPTAWRKRMEVGLAWVNSWFLRDLRTPFGGAKQSGIGREGGVHSLEFLHELKNVCIKL